MSFAIAAGKRGIANAENAFKIINNEGLGNDKKNY